MQQIKSGIIEHTTLKASKAKSSHVCGSHISKWYNTWGVEIKWL